MRCLFTMFAEDVRLLRERIFSNAFDRWLENPEVFPSEVEDLWTKMNEGGTLWGGGRIWRFNGGFFADPLALPLDRQQLRTLQRAAESDWAEVEPAIFGTLLERALDPNERHRLGAHYTPRAYVERLVRPTIEEPLRAEWETVRATVRVLLGSPDADANRKTMAEARAQVAHFLERLTQVRILDPACGTGNFLYVSLDVLKRLENEALELYEQLGGAKLTHYGRLVSPQQFLGIEIKRWAKEIAELVLWIGYLQWQVRTKGFEHPDEPILRDYHNIECRDALLAYDEKVPLIDEEGNPVTRWDGVTMKTHAVTGEDVPDETARMVVYQYVNARKAEWPEAEFIVGNPPFIGNKRMRAILGDEYVDALRHVNSQTPDSVDYVMYWWEEAAERVRGGHAQRFGLITTNSITQFYNRRVVARFLANGGTLAFAISDHPWAEDADGAAVRVAMTSGAFTLLGSEGTLGEVCSEWSDAGSGEVAVELRTQRGRINESLSVGPQVTAATRLRSNSGICFQGVKLVGDGFLVRQNEFHTPGTTVIKPYISNRDLVQKARHLWVIDFAGLSETEARDTAPAAYQRVYDTVRPLRISNRDPQRRTKWWLFGRSNDAMRRAVRGLRRFIVTPEVAKHRPFAFVAAGTIPDASLYVVASQDAYVLALLSSRAHAVWCAAAGATLEDRPRYQNGPCFEPFPFPEARLAYERTVRQIGEDVDAHRKRQQELHRDLTITAMYNVLEKLRAGEPLTAKERLIHDQGLVSVLKQLHDDLDAAVFDAYGWPHDLTDEEILERLVTLNAERAEEERRGVIRWLRPEYQNPAGATAVQASAELDTGLPAAAGVADKQIRPWPKELPAQITAVRGVVTANAGESWSAERAARLFKGAKRAQVEVVLESLSALGLLVAFGEPASRQWMAVPAAS